MRSPFCADDCMVEPDDAGFHYYWHSHQAEKHPGHLNAAEWLLKHYSDKDAFCVSMTESKHRFLRIREAFEKGKTIYA